MSPEISQNVQDWTRDQLLDQLRALYSSSGFIVDGSESLPEAVAFLARQKREDAGPCLVVGCIADPDCPIVFQAEVLEFCKSLARSGGKSGELITTGRFEQAAVDLAQFFPVRLVDGAALQAVMDLRQPDVEAPERPVIEVNPIAMEIARAKMEDANARLAQFRGGDEGPEIRKLTAPSEEKPDAKTSDEWNRIYEVPGDQELKPSAMSEKQLVGVITGIALVVLLVLFGMLYPRTSQDAAQVFAGAELPPIPEQASEDLDETLAGYALASSSSSSSIEGNEDIWTTRKKLVHRVDLLETLKAREEFEALAAELVSFVNRAQDVGVDYAKMGAYQLQATVRAASEGRGLEDLHSTKANRLQALRLTEGDQVRILPYLEISGYALKLVSDPVVVDQLLRDDQLSGFETARYEEAIRLLERRLWAEDNIDARRHAQAIESMVRAAAIANVDLLGLCNGDLDLLIKNLREGIEIADPDSPFHGHTFRTQAPEMQTISVIKQFLAVRNGRVYYHERLDDLDLPPTYFQDNKQVTTRRAVAVAEELIRHTARQIVVNMAAQRRNLIPLAFR